jgi:hypothetical protein
MLESGENAEELQKLWVITSHLLFEVFKAKSQYLLVSSGSHWKSSVIIKNEESPLLKVHTEFLILEDAAILISQNRKEHLVLKFILYGFPIDIEKVGVGRTGAIFEHIDPPPVFVFDDAHVIRDDIEHLAHSVSFEIFHPFVILLFGTDFGIELVVVQKIISMETSFLGPEVRGGIDIRNAQLMKVGDEGFCIGKLKQMIQLKAIRRNRYLSVLVKIVGHLVEYFFRLLQLHRYNPSLSTYCQPTAIPLTPLKGTWGQEVLRLFHQSIKGEGVGIENEDTL